MKFEAPDIDRGFFHTTLGVSENEHPEGTWILLYKILLNNPPGKIVN